MKTLRLIAHALRDRYRLTHPVADFESKYGFAFIVHPRTRRDVLRKYPFLRAFPNAFVDWFTSHLWPVVVSEITGLRSLTTGEPVHGWVIAATLTAEQMTKDRALAEKRIIEAVVLAQHMGVKLVGLGALTSSFTKGGIALLDDIGIGITTGHSNTASTVTGYVFAVEQLFGVPRHEIVVGVVGAAGSIGSTSAKILARAGYEKFVLIDLERKLDRCAEVRDFIHAQSPQADIQVTSNPDAVRAADFIVAATNAPEVILTNDRIKPGTVIFDDAQPSDVAAEVLDRDDVLALEAGVVATPGIDCHFNFGLKSREETFCCLGEVLVLASRGWREHYVVNRATMESVDQIAVWNRELGFTLGRFQNRKEVIPQEKIERVRHVAQERFRQQKTTSSS